MSRITRKTTLWTLRNCSTWSSKSMPRRLAYPQASPDRLCSPPVDFLFQEFLLYTSFPLRRNESARISLRGLRMRIWFDIIRRYHNVGFLVERLISASQVTLSDPNEISWPTDSLGTSQIGLDLHILSQMC